MPIYKVGNIKKEGLQKYHVRINYIAEDGNKKQITRSVYGIVCAKYIICKKFEGASDGQMLTHNHILIKNIEVKSNE